MALPEPSKIPGIRPVIAAILMLFAFSPETSPATGFFAGDATIRCKGSLKRSDNPRFSASSDQLLPGPCVSPSASPVYRNVIQGSELMPGPSGRNIRLIFYNVENLFDTVSEPGKNDDEFTPEGDRRWTEYRLQNKINNIYKALVAAAGFDIPAIIGLCEVENRYVLERLAGGTGLKNYGYKILHRNSADRRGIDVAMLYRPDDFQLLDTMFRSIRFPFDTLAATRDILYAKGLTGRADTLHLFVNHWYSRWGGQAATEPYRNYLATVLRSLTDSILSVCPRSNVVIMGDFNDGPEDMSLKRYLGADTENEDFIAGMLYNLSVGKPRIPGTLKYQGEWFLFDQFIVSGSLLDGKGNLRTSPHSFQIFSAGFLLVPDERWFGYKPFRSYEGFRYTGGYSDHLPVILDLWW